VEYFPNEVNLESEFFPLPLELQDSVISVSWATLLLRAVHFPSLNAVQQRDSSGFPHAAVKENTIHLSGLTFLSNFKSFVLFFM